MLRKNVDSYRTGRIAAKTVEEPLERHGQKEPLEVSKRIREVSKIVGTVKELSEWPKSR